MIPPDLGAALRGVLWVPASTCENKHGERWDCCSGEPDYDAMAALVSGWLAEKDAEIARLTLGPEDIVMDRVTLDELKGMVDPRPPVSKMEDLVPIPRIRAWAQMPTKHHSWRKYLLSALEHLDSKTMEITQFAATHGAREGALLANLATLTDAARGLAKVTQSLDTKMDALMPAIDSAFAFQGMHGFPYSGPTWVTERADLKAALADPQVQAWLREGER